MPVHNFLTVKRL